MSRLNERELTLVGLGAALASNCVPCIESLIPRARRAGWSEAQIKEAVQIADRVRRVPARAVMQAAMACVRGEAIDGVEPVASGCGCAGSSGTGRAD